MPHNEVKSLCKAGKLREAIDFVSRIKSGPGSGKTEDLILIGECISNQPNSVERDKLAASVVEDMLQLGDIEHPSPLILLLNDVVLAAKFCDIIGDAVRQRQDDLALSTF